MSTFRSKVKVTCKGSLGNNVFRSFKFDGKLRSGSQLESTVTDSSRLLSPFISQCWRTFIAYPSTGGDKWPSIISRNRKYGFFFSSFDTYFDNGLGGIVMDPEGFRKCNIGRSNGVHRRL